MKFVANGVNGVHLRDLLPVISEGVEVDSVVAAIAYGGSASDEIKDLVGHAVSNQLRLDLWMRYDHTVPVAVSFLQRLLKHQRDNVFSQFVPDCFHSKVIWWKGYGAYIGSANHTDKGWLTNIEAGVFVDEDELIANNMDVELNSFFDYLSEIDKLIPLSADYIAEMENHDKINRGRLDKARDARKHPIWEGPAFVAKKAAFDKRKDNFKQEWLSTLSKLKHIESELASHKPPWITDEIPLGWQVDQFLHAYYYNRVGDKLRKPYEEDYKKHKANPNGELQAQLAWWKGTVSAPSNEDVTFYENAPAIRELLKQEKILTLTSDDFQQICSKTHATLDHVIKIPMDVLGKPELTSMPRGERLKLFAPFILRERNKKGWDIRQLLYYVMYEGDDDSLWERLYHAGRDSDYTISRYGLNSIAEVVGWARPEVAPPRNGRTSKALRALGFDVKIY